MAVGRFQEIDPLGPLKEGLETCLRATKDQRMHVMRAFVGVHRFKVHCVAHNLKVLGDAIAAMHVPRGARDIESFATVVAFHDADRLGRGTPCIH